MDLLINIGNDRWAIGQWRYLWQIRGPRAFDVRFNDNEEIEFVDHRTRFDFNDTLSHWNRYFTKDRQLFYLDDSGCRLHLMRSAKLLCRHLKAQSIFKSPFYQIDSYPQSIRLCYRVDFRKVETLEGVVYNASCLRRFIQLFSNEYESGLVRIILSFVYGDISILHTHKQGDIVLGKDTIPLLLTCCPDTVSL